MAAVIAAALIISSTVLAQSTLTGTTTAVNTGQGDQASPHVSGDYVAYTSNADQRGDSAVGEGPDDRSGSGSHRGGGKR
jgi:hypothetical protein